MTEKIIEAIARQECIAEGYDPDEMTTGFASNPTTPKYPFWKAYVSGTEATLAALRATGFWVAPWEATISMEVAGEDAYDRTPASRISGSETLSSRRARIPNASIFCAVGSW